MGGKGVATCRTADGWSAPAFFTVSGGSWGLQIGVEAVDVVAIFQNDKAMRRLLSSNFQIGADASAAAGPVGRHAAGRYGLEVEYGNPDLLPCQGCVCWAHRDGCFGSRKTMIPGTRCTALPGHNPGVADR